MLKMTSSLSGVHRDCPFYFSGVKCRVMLPHVRGQAYRMFRADRKRSGFLAVYAPASIARRLSCVLRRPPRDGIWRGLRRSTKGCDAECT
jgi:hypothetical protein